VLECAGERSGNGALAMPNWTPWPSAWPKKKARPRPDPLLV